MSQVITVFAANTPLGSATTRSLSLSYTVRAVVTNIDDAQTTAWKASGIEVIQVDIQDPRSVYQALDGAHGCVAITNTNFNHPNSESLEYQEGKAIAEACVKAGVEHVVFNTQLSVVKTLGLTCTHMDTKAKIETYMNNLGLPLTAILLPVFYEHFLTSTLRPTKEHQNSFAFEVPMGYTPLNLISVEDAGEIIRQVFDGGRQFLGKTLSLTGDKLTIKELAAVFTKHLHPKQFRDKQVTVKQFREKGFAGCHDLANMFDFFCRVDQRFSLDLTKKIHPGVRTVAQWIEQNRHAISNAVDVSNSEPYQTLMAV